MLKRMTLLIIGLMPALAMAQPLDSVAAVVNEGIITSSELQRQVELLRQQISAKGVPVPEDKVLKKQVLDHLIDEDLQLQVAKLHHISIEDAEVNEAIEKIAESNHLTSTQLHEEVQRQGLTWKTYRANIQKEILLSRVQQKSVGQEIVVTPKQVEEYLKLPHQQDTSNITYHFQNIVVPLSEDPTTQQVAHAREKAQDLLAKIKKGADFEQIAVLESSGDLILSQSDLGPRHLAQLPELFAQKAISMKPGQIAGPLRAGNGFQLIKLLAVNAETSHHLVTKTHVRHILLKQDPGTTATEAQKKAYNLYQQIKGGKSFDAMAKHYSLDGSSAIKGGDLGWVSAGELVPAFEKTMNTLPLHQVSKPVKTGFGWHLIEVLERKQVDDSNAFQRQKVTQYLQQRKFSEVVQNWLQHLRADAYIKIMDKELA